MSRRRACRRVSFNPQIRNFKPQGVPLRNLETITLRAEEVEALRLKNIEGFDQNTCAQKMNTSQSTFQRILASAYQKMSDAIINAKAIKIDLNDKV